jgi:hypothetical protein
MLAHVTMVVADHPWLIQTFLFFQGTIGLKGQPHSLWWGVRAMPPCAAPQVYCPASVLLHTTCSALELSSYGVSRLRFNMLYHNPGVC